MKKRLFAIAMAAALLMGCAGIGVQVEGAGNQSEAVNMGLELLAFNGGYLVADKWPDKYGEIAKEIALLEGVLAGDSVETANAAFQVAVQRLLKETNDDPLVAANVMYLSKKIKFTSTGSDGKPLLDIPQMKLILENFKSGAETRAMLGH
jgi:hypothetical protein